MKKSHLTVLSFVIIVTVGLTISTFSSDGFSLKAKTSTTEQKQSKISTLQNVADKSGQQIQEENQPRRLPPPPISAPDRGANKSQSLHALQHGHESNYSRKQGDKNTAPPPVGARNN
jgi:hypothetical protein